MKKTEPMEFTSSYGSLYVNEDGSVQRIHFDSSNYKKDDCWLTNIQRIDMEELIHYYKLNDQEFLGYGDVMDFGYWNKDGDYEQPPRDWRKEVFHATDIDVEVVIDNSYEWINQKRKQQ
tara:strand:- start:349 stop:705 length:357 start_codon:yes stop_codon:yes gene_type:complete